LAHLFSDNTTDVTGDFELGMRPYRYADKADFKDRVDLSVAGMAQDCGECHVGGGAMEYVPAPTMDGRTSLRDITTEVVNSNSTLGGGDYTAFNYFIDTYNVDGDNITSDGSAAKTDVLYMDWDNTGVLEMDCLLCHLEGYDYDARVATQRAAKFDASRAVGAGIADPNNVVWAVNSTAPSGYGTEVFYNDLVVDNGSGLELSDTVLLNIKGVPPSENCAFCHANWPGVDWKKRGDSWRNERTDAHWVLNCMGCHERKVGDAIGTSGNASAGADYDALGQCDPAKAHAPYSSNWNEKDDTVKTCEDCHLNAGYDSILAEYSPDYGAPDPTGTHEYYGLTAKLCQKGVDGNMTINSASHLDVIDCAACHIRKIGDEAWNTGGCVVDATGPDLSGRLTDHENHYVLRNMEENLCYTWLDKKVVPASVLTTIFYRDIAGGFDANRDGGNAGMDALLMPDVLRIDIDNGWTNMAEDLLGTITESDIDARLNVFNLDTRMIGADIKLCAMAVPFRVTHNVSPAGYALGHSCDDCHGAAAGIFNGAYDLQGEHMNLSYNATTQTTGLTSVNSPAQSTDVHGNLKTKLGTRSIARRVFSGFDSMPPVDRSEFLYEDNLTASGNIKAVTSPYTVYTTRAGWVGYLNTLDTSGCACYPSAVASCTGPYNVQGLHGYGIGCNCGNDTYTYFDGDVSPTTGIVYGVNATDDSDYEHCVAPSPWVIYEVKACQDINFHAEDVCGGEYWWNFNDASGLTNIPGNSVSAVSAVGQNVTHEFRDLGIFKVTLTVKNLYGNVDSQMIEVNVVK
jgi:hypothetical protein